MGFIKALAVTLELWIAAALDVSWFVCQASFTGNITKRPRFLK